MCQTADTPYRLVHDAKGNLWVLDVFRGDLAPERSKLRIGWTALTNDLTIPSAVVVHIDNAHLRGCLQACLNQIVVGREVVRIEGAAEIVVDEILPRDGKAEDVESVIVGEVLHLFDTLLTRRESARKRAASVCAGSEVQPSDIDTGVLDGSSHGRASCRGERKNGSLHLE